MTNTLLNFCQEEIWFQRIKPFLEEHNTARNWLWVLGALFVASIIMVSVVALSKKHHAKIHIDKTRNYALIPFDELDAIRVCENETEARFGEQLLRTTVDQHSTRFDKLSGNHKIFMIADIGNLQYYDEVTVHCFVDPQKFMIDHYRMIFDKKESILDKAMNLFGFTVK